MYQLIKNYQNSPPLRQSFNQLAAKTFGLNFESWYQNGFWRNSYIPYSIVQEGNIVANVSVNLINMWYRGAIKHFIQLGTVMTDESCRNQGYIRQIMKEIEKDYSGIDGMYLFANDSVLDFYPKFGFERAKEYQCSKQISIAQNRTMVPVPMNNRESWGLLEDAINHSVPQGGFEMSGNSGLIMFYVTGHMQQNVYYDRHLDTYAIAGLEDDLLLLHAIFAHDKLDLDTVLQAFGKQVKRVRLCFTPECKVSYTVNPLEEADTTLFVKGKGFVNFSNGQLCFPTLTHA